MSEKGSEDDAHMIGITQSIMSFKSPPDPNSIKALTKKATKRNIKVLDEDEYVQKVEKIIEKDFFPELDRLKAQSEYIEAADRKDELTMSRLRERFSTSSSVHRNRLQDPIERFSSPATFETPQEQRNEFPEFETPTRSEREFDMASVSSSKTSEKKEDKKVSLDQFMRNHTSEDNESFYELMKESEADFRRTHSWMFKAEEQLSIENKSEQLALPSIEMQAKGSETKSTRPLDGWTYKNVNSVFYHPDGAAFTDAEKIEMAKKEKLIVHENTRFSANPWKTNVSDKFLKDSATARKEAIHGKVGVDGKELIDPAATPSVNGYNLLRITDPSPMINPGESPLMTWGEIESTPYRLEGCETPLLNYSGEGPTFKIQAVPKRDRIAHELAEKNSKFYRDKKNKAVQQARTSLKTPKSVGSLSVRVSTMTPAAQRLATTKLGIRLGTDKALQASYTPSPMRTPKSSVRSSISSSVRLNPMTPRNVATPTLASKAKLSDVDTATLTDNLLNLPSTSKQRPRASDFFK